jgi:hypothetical protein
VTHSVPPLTIVCCIEAGPLEQQTLLMIRSLRHFGGELADVPVIAVVGRRGPELQSATRRNLDQLGATLEYAQHGDNPAPWFPYGNKAAAVAVGQRYATTEIVAWLDSDILVAQQPSGLLLPEGCDFAGRSEFLPPAIMPDDPANVGYWSAVCRLFGLDLAAIPWVDRGDCRPPQKMFFNSGVFAWRRSSKFAAAYGDAFSRLLRSRLAQRNGDFHFIDQVILTPVVLGQGLPWHHLSGDEHFMIFQGFIDGPDAAPVMSSAELIHYSRSLHEPFRERFMARLREEVPYLHRWLICIPEQQQADAPSGTRRLTLAALRKWRGLCWRFHARRVRRCKDDGTDFSHPATVSAPI